MGKNIPNIYRNSKENNAFALTGTIMVFLLFSIFSDSFFTVYNISNILKNCAVLFIAAIGTTIAILLGNNDISIGSVMSLSGIVAALLMKADYGVFIGVVAGISTGMISGIVNGVLIVYFKANFWIATFAMYSVAQGIAMIISNGNGIAGFPDVFRFLGTGKIGGMYVIVYIAVFLFFLILIVLDKTRFGSRIYAVGGNEEAAELSGIRAGRTKFYVFMLSGTFAGMAGILLAAKTNVAMPSGGAGYEFDAIAAVIIGGTSLDGGKGGIKGTAVGVFLITVIRNGLTVIGLSSVFHYLVIGLIIMAVIVVDVMQLRLKEHREERAVYGEEKI